MGNAETFHGYAPDLGYEFLRNAIAEKTIRAVAAIFMQMRYLSAMVQNVIQEIFRRYLE